MGRIGSELSRRAIAFGMRVLAYDPYLSSSRARSFQVELLEELDDLLPLADFITLHTPLTPETHHLLDAARLAKTKRGVRADQLRARRLDRRNGARRGVAERTGRGRGARCFRNGAAAGRLAAARGSKPGSYPASRRLDVGSAGKRRDRDRAVDSRRPSRGHDSQRGQHAESRRENARHCRTAPALRRKARALPLASSPETGRDV